MIARILSEDRHAIQLDLDHAARHMETVTSAPRLIDVEDAPPQKGNHRSVSGKNADLTVPCRGDDPGRGSLKDDLLGRYHPNLEDGHVTQPY